MKTAAEIRTILLDEAARLEVSQRAQDKTTAQRTLRAAASLQEFAAYASDEDVVRFAEIIAAADL